MMKNSRITVIFLSVFLAFASHGATVVWNSFTARTDAVWGEGPFYWMQGYSYTSQAGLYFSLAVEAGLSGWQASQFLGGGANVWARVMNKGDLVDASTMHSAGLKYFYHSIYEGDKVEYDYSIPYDVAETIFLAIAVEGSVSEFEQYPIYGWVEVSFQGEPTYLSSAWDMDGGAMYVGGGAIPEPSSAALLLLGLAGLSLKRKRVTA